MSILKRIIKSQFKYFIYFYRYLGYLLFVRLFLSMIVGILDGFGLTMFLPLLQLADGKAEANPENLGNLSFLIDALSALDISLTLTNTLILLSIFFILKGLITYANELLETYLGESFIRKVRLKLLTGINNLTFSHFVNADVGRMQNSTTSE